MPLNDNSLHAIVVTYRRRSALGSVLDGLAAQTVTPSSVVVVDNAADPTVGTDVHAQSQHTYIAADTNLGPAGGLARGFEALEADDNDWVLFADDDDPPPDARVIEQLLSLRDRQPDRNQLGGVGLVGARYSRPTGLSRRLKDDELDGDLFVDFIGGNQFPIYSVRALRHVGPMKSDLFFGLEELDLGLRLRASGYRLVVDGTAWRTSRERTGRTGLTARTAARGRTRTAWRRYYTVRNQTWIARQHGALTAPFVVSVRSGLGSALADSIRNRSPRAALPAIHGCLDGWRGRLGRTVEPEGDGMLSSPT